MRNKKPYKDRAVREKINTEIHRKKMKIRLAIEWKEEEIFLFFFKQEFFLKKDLNIYYLSSAYERRCWM